jgi:23S rRNA (uracil1939-C5)-methyltransferase
VSARRDDGLRAGEIVELTVEKPVYRGRGLARHGGRVVLVPRAHAGDRLRARIVRVHAGWAEAEPVEVLVPSPQRRAAPCPHAGACGGCAYQDLAYDEQLRAKEAVLRESLQRAGAPFEGAIPVAGSPEQGWRMRASLHFDAAGQALRLGLREEGSRRLVPLDACLQLSDAMNRAARAAQEALARHPVFWPQLRGLDLLEANDGSSLVVALDSTLRPAQARDLAGLGPSLPGVSGFGVMCDRDRLQWLHGAPHVEAVVLGQRLRAHVRSFFQANRFLLEPLAAGVLALVPRGEGPALDLYAGVGLFALPLAARDGAPVTAVEGSPSSCEDARANAARAGLRSVRVLEADVASALAGLPVASGERIVLDPPRTGAGPEVVDAVASRRPSLVVYVSCDPPTLGRDLARFAARGYRAESVHLFDMFPDTFHLESVVRLLPA